MKKIASFCVDHDVLECGMYISRIDGDAVTYDIRTVKPNTPPFMETAAIHTIEHLFATYVRNGEYSDNIIYFGPMGCRTGFYLIVRDSVSGEEAVRLVEEAFRFIADYEGVIPGTSRKECGNYLEHDLNKAREYAKKYVTIIEKCSENTLKYQKPQK